MRTREQIIEEVGNEARDQAIQIELLLDIRDILSQENNPVSEKKLNDPEHHPLCVCNVEVAVEEEQLGCAAGCTKSAMSLSCPNHFKED